MATTFTRLLVHIVFSTKNRTELIKPEIEADLYAYMKGIAKNHDSPVLAINGTADHVHLLVSLSKGVAVAVLLENLKKDSSVWIKTQGPQYKRFYWQEGYGAFTIGESAVAALKQYIANQKAHHRKISYKEELLNLLKKYQIDYDERYLWT
jgi:REP element-mobilizing transposase RayT